MYASRGSKVPAPRSCVDRVGEPGLDTGADFDVDAADTPLFSASKLFEVLSGRTRGVPHISHSRRYGWLRNVQTEHAIELGFRFRLGTGFKGLGSASSVVANGAGVLADDDGSDLESKWDDVEGKADTDAGDLSGRGGTPAIPGPVLLMG